jgi:hypothetical protein
MPALRPGSIALLTETVLNERADRGDRRFSLQLLLDLEAREARHFAGSHSPVEAALGRIARECRDPFLAGLARTTVEPRLLAAELRGRVLVAP